MGPVLWVIVRAKNSTASMRHPHGSIHGFVHDWFHDLTVDVHVCMYVCVLHSAVFRLVFRIEELNTLGAVFL